MACHTVSNDGSLGAVRRGHLQTWIEFSKVFRDLLADFKPLVEVERGIVQILCKDSGGVFLPTLTRT